MHALCNNCHYLRMSKSKFYFHTAGWVPPQTAQDVDDSEAATLHQSQLLSMGKQNGYVHRRVVWCGMEPSNTKRSSLTN